MNGIAQANQTNKMPHVAAATQLDQQQPIPSTAIKVEIYDGLARIIMSGRFDFQMSRNFRNTYVPLLNNTAVKEIRVDMSKVDYLDSSAMGMLLLLDERAKAADKPVALLTAPGVVRQVLKVANFGKIFSIKHVNGKSVVNDSPVIAP